MENTSIKILWSYKILAWLSMNDDNRERQNWIAYTSCNLQLLALRIIVKENCVFSQIGKQIKSGPSSRSLEHDFMAY